MEERKGEILVMSLLGERSYSHIALSIFRLLVALLAFVSLIIPKVSKDRKFDTISVISILDRSLRLQRLSPPSLPYSWTQTCGGE